jgi:hypothetical protein
MHDEAFSIILWAVKEVMVNGFFSVWAYRAIGGVTLVDAVEMSVEGYVSGAEVHE